MAERFERIAVGTVEGMRQFLSGRGRFLGVDYQDVPRLNTTERRSELVPPDEIEEMLAHHGDVFEEAREIYEVVRASELDHAAGGDPTGNRPLPSP